MHSASKHNSSSVMFMAALVALLGKGHLRLGGFPPPSSESKMLLYFNEFIRMFAESS